MELFGTRLLVDNFPETFRFWRDAVKLKLSFGDEAMGYAFFETPKGGLELMGRQGYIDSVGDQAKAGREAVILFKVENVDAAYNELLSHGGKSVHAPEDRAEWGARSAQVADPDGHVLEVYSMLQQSG